MAGFAGRHFTVWIMLISCTLSSPIALAAEQWTRTQAIASSQHIDLNPLHAGFQAHLRDGDVSSAVTLLKVNAQASHWTAPVRDRFVFETLQSLRHAEHSPAPELVHFYRSYEPQTLVAEEDHPRAMVPLFDIQSTVAGVENHWARITATQQGLQILQQDTSTYVSDYRLLNAAAQRRGYREALSSISASQRNAVIAESVSQLNQAPELAMLAGEAARLNGDVPTSSTLILNSDPATAASLLRDSQPLFDASQAKRLLNDLASQQDYSLASMAIAIHAKTLLEEQSTAQWLIRQLPDPNIGATVALALARHGDSQVRAHLQSLAAQEQDSLESHRARLALESTGLQTGGVK